MAKPKKSEQKENPLDSTLEFDLGLSSNEDIESGENLSDRIIEQHRYGLNFKQQRIVENNLKAKDLVELTKTVFRNPTLTASSPEFKGVRGFFHKCIRGKKAHDYRLDEIEFIRNNGETMRCADIVRHLYPEEKGGLIKEMQTASLLLKAMGIEFQGSDTNEELNTDEKYVPPETDHKIIALINRCDQNANYAIQKLDMRKRECISCLKRNLQSERFIVTMNSIKRKDHRSIFEREYVAATYDKPDINTEERNAYIDLCYDYVIAAQTQEQITSLNDRFYESISDDENGKKWTMSLVESLGKKTGEYDDCRKRIFNNAKALSGQRSGRLEELNKTSTSLAKFVEMVQDEDKRRRLIIAAKAQELLVSKEADSLDNFESIFCEVYGVSKAELFT